MNIYKKYCPNVFVAQCEEEHKKGAVITVETKYGKENEHPNSKLETIQGDIYGARTMDEIMESRRKRNKIK